jgi:hypothetical protein
MHSSRLEWASRSLFLVSDVGIPVSGIASSDLCKNQFNELGCVGSPCWSVNCGLHILRSLYPPLHHSRSNGHLALPRLRKIMCFEWNSACKSVATPTINQSKGAHLHTLFHVRPSRKDNGASS